MERPYYRHFLLEFRVQCHRFHFLAKSLLILTLAGLLVFAEPVPRCPPGLIHHRDTGSCCEPTTCGKGQQIVKCDKHGGKDSCEPCPLHTFRFDSSTSHHPFRCSPYNCDPITSKESDILSTDINPSACAKFCQCDMGKNFCGTDPCKCKPMEKCDFGTERNQQCGCQPIKRGVTTEVSVMTNTEKQPTVPQDTTTKTWNTELPIVTFLTTVGDTNSRQHGNMNGTMHSKNLWVVPVVVFAVSIPLAIVIIWLAINRKKRSSTRNASCTCNINCGGKYNTVDQRINPQYEDD